MYFDYVKEMQCFILPRVEIITKCITNRPFIWSHSLLLSDSMLCHFAEVALPFASWELLQDEWGYECVILSHILDTLRERQQGNHHSK